VPQEVFVTDAISRPVANQLIAALPRAERERLLTRCEPFDLVFGTVLCEPDQVYRNVYFPLSGFISLVEGIRGHPPLEMALIGNEGMLGATMVLRIPAVPLRAVVQGAGSAWRISASQFQRELADSEALRRALSRYLYMTLRELSQTAACTYFHEIGARLARWLLMTHDRAHADHFHLTHQFMADMLGVQRSAITIAAGALQKRKLIRYTRGEISILDRHGLEQASCECYALMNDRNTNR
jgi:CRP-like cAMP-binding protein